MLKFKYPLIFACLSLLLMGQSCASYLPLNLKGYPAQTRTVFLHNITNNSFSADVNTELTQWLRIELHRRGNFTLVKKREDARLWLYGNISVYRKEGRMYDNYRNAIRSELIIACRVKVYQNAVKVDSAPRLPNIMNRELVENVEFSDKEGYTETEKRARNRLLRRLAREIAAAMEQEFNSKFQPHYAGKK